MKRMPLGGRDTGPAAPLPIQDGDCRYGVEVETTRQTLTVGGGHIAGGAEAVCVGRDTGGHRVAADSGDSDDIMIGILEL